MLTAALCYFAAVYSKGTASWLPSALALTFLVRNPPQPCSGKSFLLCVIGIDRTDRAVGKGVLGRSMAQRVGNVRPSRKDAGLLDLPNVHLLSTHPIMVY